MLLPSHFQKMYFLLFENHYLSVMCVHSSVSQPLLSHGTYNSRFSNIECKVNGFFIVRFCVRTKFNLTIGTSQFI